MIPLRLYILLLPVLAGACRSLPPGVPGSYAPTAVPEALEEVDQELAQGEYEVALARARIASETSGLTPELRNEAQKRLEAAARARVQELSEEGERPGELQDIFELELPRQLSVAAGIEAARLYYQVERERMQAYRLIKKVDAKYPQHQERARAAALLYDIGMDLADDEGRYFLFFSYRALAPEVLEYLVIEHPEERRGDQVYRRLAEIYEQDERWLLAIERREDLILWHPHSDYVPESRARIPHLRLQYLKSPEYDRTELVKARGELESWLAEYSGLSAEDPSLYRAAQIDLVDCLQRLADSDLGIARFYLTVGNAFGAELHAQRAIEEAGAGGDEKQLAEANTLLERVQVLADGARRQHTDRPGGLEAADLPIEIDELGSEP